MVARARVGKCVRVSVCVCAEVVAWIDLLYAEYCEFVKRNIYKAGATPADRWRAL